MRLRPRLLALLVAIWGLALVLLGRHAAGTGCSPGSCAACGACLRPPAAEQTAKEVRVG